MRPVSFIEPIRYDPLLLISEPDLSGRLKEMSWLERCAFAELMSGNLKTRVFYAVAQQRQAVSIAQPTDEGLVPRLIDMEGAAAAAALRQSGRIRITLDGLTISLSIGEAECDALALFDEKRTIGEIQRESGVAPFRRIFSILNALNTAFLCMPAPWRLSG